MDAGLALNKAEAMFFYKKFLLKRKSSSTCIKGRSAFVQVGWYMKYFGLTLDKLWVFEEHFKQISLRASGIAGALSHYYPTSAAPIKKQEDCTWTPSLYVSRILMARWFLRVLARAAQRKMTIRITCVYRKVFFATFTALAGTPPIVFGLRKGKRL